MRIQCSVDGHRQVKPYPGEGENRGIAVSFLLRIQIAIYWHHHTAQHPLDLGQAGYTPNEQPSIEFTKETQTKVEWTCILLED